MEINMKRVGALIKRDWILYKRNYTLGVLILFVLCTIVMFLISDEADPETPVDAPELVFIVMLYFVGSFHTLRSYREFSRHADAVTYLGIPASHIEKFLSRWIITLPVFLSVCIAVFSISYLLLSIIAEQTWGVIFTPFSSFEWSNFFKFILFFIFFHSLFFLFALMFSKNSVTKSIIVFIGLWFVFILFNYYINSGSIQADDSFKALLMSNYRYLMLLAVPILWFSSYSILKAKTA